MAAGFDLTRTARSLLNIEVNTIVRDDITGEEIPPVPHALLDIAGWYADTLCANGIDLGAYFAGPAGDPPPVSPTWTTPPAGGVGGALTVSVDTFVRLRWAAQWALGSNDPAAARLTGAARGLLNRVVNNSDAIKEMFKRFDPSLLQYMNKTRADLVALTFKPSSYAIAPDDLMQLQKVWDIGVEQIVAQTVVHITGDVTTRVQDALRGAGSEPLFAIHRQSIDVSVSRWRDLLDAVKEIAGATINVLLGGGLKP
jgi:hypothetical protein